MDRMMIPRRILTAAGLALALALLSTCNQFSLLGTLTDEVKLANNKFLLIKGFTPVNGAQEVNPGAPVNVQFDRPLDMATVTESSIVVSPMTDIDHLDFTFHASGNTLDIDAYPLYKDNLDYSITITKGVRGTDGSDMQNELSWSYKTGTYPSGNVKIKAGGVVDATYVTNTNPVILVIDTNVIVTQYRVSTVDPITLPADAGWVNKPSTHFEVDPFSLEAGEGEKWAWAQFTDGPRVSTAKFDTIIRDTIPPAAPTWDTARTTASPSLDNTPTWWWIPSEAGAAKYRYVLDGAPSFETDYTYFTSGTVFDDDTTHTLRVAQKDQAGWWSADSTPRSIYITPCIPLDKATGVSIPVTLKWREIKGARGYTLYVAQYSPVPKFQPYRIGLEPIYEKLELKGGTPYIWYVTAAVGLRTYRLPAEEDTYYSFATK